MDGPTEERVRERILAAIADHGPIGFDEFMAIALYSPGGFYDRPPIGETGHFVTSPHVHPVFADLLRFALDELREELGSPDPFPIVELGAGDGTLARQLLDGYAQASPVAVDYTAIEIGAGARARLAELGVHVLERVEDLDADPVCAFANEVFDNLPFRRVVRTDRGPREVRIATDGTSLIETLVELDPELIDGRRVDRELIIPTGVNDLIDQLAPRVLGYLLVIDYGAEEAATGVHGYRRHRVVEDLLDRPGSSDITAGVDFGELGRRALRHGLRSLGLVTQSAALRALGFGRWERRQLQRQQSALTERSPDAIGAWQSRERARRLVDPAGLGRLRWLLLARPPLEAPPWLARALAPEERPSADRPGGPA